MIYFVNKHLKQLFLSFEFNCFANFVLFYQTLFIKLIVSIFRFNIDLMSPKDFLLTTKDLSPIATNEMNEGKHFIALKLICDLFYTRWVCFK